MKVKNALFLIFTWVQLNGQSTDTCFTVSNPSYKGFILSGRFSEIISDENLRSFNIIGEFDTTRLWKPSKKEIKAFERTLKDSAMFLISDVNGTKQSYYDLKFHVRQYVGLYKLNGDRVLLVTFIRYPKKSFTCIEIKRYDPVDTNLTFYNNQLRLSYFYCFYMEKPKALKFVFN